ncbi:MAG: hypothetical protein GY909_16915 [Oligoflexia bacterium]|nr:hypothetical protein [Oligoflexia bacterium]
MTDEKDKKLGDVLKKVASLGMGAAFMTEDAIKNIVADLPIPKDIVAGLLQNAKTAKEDFATSLREEFRKYLSKLDTETLIDYILTNYDVELDAKFRFKKKDATSKKNGSEGDS